MKRKFNSFDGTETDTEDLKEAEKFLIRDTFIKGTESISMSKEEFKEELRKAAKWAFDRCGATWIIEATPDFDEWYKENHK
jgi:hypothetical protein